MASMEAPNQTVSGGKEGRIMVGRIMKERNE
jgi:hypothetical protein